MPQDDHRFVIKIYHNGCVIGMPTEEQDRYVKEKRFLDELTGMWYSQDILPRPIPDPEFDFYMLDDDQFDDYLEFRKSLREQQSL